VKVIVEAGERVVAFEAEACESILAAALRQRIAMPYECATGTCGTCRARLVAGAVDEGWPAAPARRMLKADRGEILTCQSAALSDCTLRAAEPLGAWRDGGAPPSAATARLASLRALTHDMLAITLELAQPFDFQAGQFALLRAPGVAGWRAYSMADAEASSMRLNFIIKRKPDGGFSRWLFEQAAAGDQVELFGPLGAAVFEPALAHDLLVIVGGSGLAVALAVLGRAEACGYLGPHRARLFFGVRTTRDLCALELLSRWRECHGEALQVTVALSDAAPGAAERANWPALDFGEGMVHEVAARGLSNGAGNSMAFLAGPPPMVDATLRTLIMKARIPPARIRYDKFS
jgi:toluene monooxygenase electron transfer component